MCPKFFQIYNQHFAFTGNKTEIKLLIFLIISDLFLTCTCMVSGCMHFMNRSVCIILWYTRERQQVSILLNNPADAFFIFSPVHGVSGFHGRLVTHAIIERGYLEIQEQRNTFPKRLVFVTIRATPLYDLT